MKQVQILSDGDPEIMEMRLNDELWKEKDEDGFPAVVSSVQLCVIPAEKGHSSTVYTAMIVYEYPDESGRATHRFAGVADLCADCGEDRKHWTHRLDFRNRQETDDASN